MTEQKTKAINEIKEIKKTRFTKNTINTLKHITKDMMKNECIEYYINSFNKHWLANEVSLKKLFDILLDRLFKLTNEKNVENINKHLIKKYEWTINNTESEPYVYRQYKKKYNILLDCLTIVQLIMELDSANNIIKPIINNENFNINSCVRDANINLLLLKNINKNDCKMYLKFINVLI